MKSAKIAVRKPIKTGLKFALAGCLFLASGSPSFAAFNFGSFDWFDDNNDRRYSYPYTNPYRQGYSGRAPYSSRRYEPRWTQYDEWEPNYWRYRYFDTDDNWRPGYGSGYGPGRWDDDDDWFDDMPFFGGDNDFFGDGRGNGRFNFDFDMDFDGSNDWRGDSRNYYRDSYRDSYPYGRDWYSPNKTYGYPPSGRRPSYRDRVFRTDRYRENEGNSGRRNSEMRNKNNPQPYNSDNRVDGESDYTNSPESRYSGSPDQGYNPRYGGGIGGYDDRYDDEYWRNYSRQNSNPSRNSRSRNRGSSPAPYPR